MCVCVCVCVCVTYRQLIHVVSRVVLLQFLRMHVLMFSSTKCRRFLSCSYILFSGMRYGTARLFRFFPPLPRLRMGPEAEKEAETR